MRVNIFFLEADKNLSKPLKEELRKIIRKHAEKAGKILGVKLVNFTVYPSHSAVIPETGETASTWQKDCIHVMIDPSRSRAELRKIIHSIIPSTIYHEMYHLGRGNWRPWQNFKEAIVGEGLADAFAEEQWPEFKAPWVKASKRSIRTYIAKSKKKGDLNEKLFGWNKWPKWMGYKLGAYIVREAKKRNPGLQASNIIDQSADEVLRLSGVELPSV